MAQGGKTVADRSSLLLDGVAVPVFGAAAEVLAPIVMNALGLTPTDLAAYKLCWASATSSIPPPADAIPAAAAADYFKTSGLPNGALRRVWRGAYTTGRKLSQRQFFNALKLIAAEQKDAASGGSGATAGATAGAGATAAEQLAATGCAIPAFNGAAPPPPAAPAAAPLPVPEAAPTPEELEAARQAAAAAALEAEQQAYAAKVAALVADPPDFARYDSAGKFSLKALFKTRALGAAPKDVVAMRAALTSANEALAERYGNALAASILNYEHSTKVFGGSVASVTKLCNNRGLDVPSNATTWEEIAKVLAENCELPLGVEFGNISAGVAYKDATSESLIKACGELGLALPGSGAGMPWYELVKCTITLDSTLLAWHTSNGTPAADASAKIEEDKVRLKATVWELQVQAVSAKLAALAKTRGAECPDLRHTVALPANELVQLVHGASKLLTGDGSSLEMYTNMPLKKLQQRCMHRGVVASPEEVEAEAAAQMHMAQGRANPCQLCSRKMAVGAGTGQCWPWCQRSEGPDEDAKERAKQKAARGLVHLEESIKAAYSPAEWEQLASGFQGMGASELSMRAGKCRPKIDVSNLLPGSAALVDRLVLETDVMKFMKIKVMARRREMMYEDELGKSHQIAADLAEGKDDTKMWHVFTRWEGAHDDEEKSVDLDPEIPPIPSDVGKDQDSHDALVHSVFMVGAPPPPASPAGLRSHCSKPRDFKGKACSLACCDLHFNTGNDFEPSTCSTRPNRKTKLRFADELVASELPKEGFAVPFLALKAFAPPDGKAGYLPFVAGQTLFVWNETGSPDAELGIVGPDGGLWMEGWVGHGSERPLYQGDEGFGEGIEGYAAGIFPGACVTKPP